MFQHFYRNKFVICFGKAYENYAMKFRSITSMITKRQTSTREGNINISLSDENILQKVKDGKIKPYALENTLGDTVRAARIRRSVIQSQIIDAKTSKTRQTGLQNLPLDNFDSKKFFDAVHGTNCENVVGFVPIPVGIVGPLLLDESSIHVPMATTEGALIASTNRGARAITLSGGCNSIVLKDGMTRAPVIALPNILECAKVKFWIEDSRNFEFLQSTFSSTTRFGKLLDVQCQVAGRTAHIRFRCETGDAMGMNMVSKGVQAVMEKLVEAFPSIQVESLSGNLCTDKKPSAINWITGRGKSVVVETILKGDILKKVLKTNVSDLVSLNHDKNLVGSALAGGIGGNNAHAANMVAAVFLATGQDPAQVVESSNCLTLMEPTNGGKDLHVSVTMPCIEVGTVGGGTGLPPQAANLDILSVRGPCLESPGKNAASLARTIAATVLAGEISLMSAHASGHLISAHMSLNRAKRDRFNAPTMGISRGSMISNTNDDGNSN